ncbi:hypothetical protein [Streptomyces zaomyceticus]|uniref:hypothetical protein n=1 Tax=Streptomyces zaomyceticus TaxID=68286 RepID=UPI00342AD1FB
MTGLVITASTLREGADAVVAEVLHHAAHLLSWLRDTPDTHSRGHYHTKKFVEAAADVGLVWPADKPRDSRRGFADVELTPEAHDRHVADVVRLEEVIPGSLPHLEPPPVAPSSRRERITLRCACTPRARTLRIHSTVADEGPIVCGVCKSPFVAD